MKILVAGMPRSGSTWLFNAVRLVTSSKFETYGCWVGDYDVNYPASVHLVKIHDKKDKPFEADFIFTNYRAFEDCLKSKARMNWLDDTNRKAYLKALDVQKKSYVDWFHAAHYEVQYEDILTRPAFVLRTIAEILDIKLDFEQSREMAMTLKAMQAPQEKSNGYDKETLLHPNHRS